MPDVSKMKVNKLSRKSFKSKRGLKKKGKPSKFNKEKVKQLQSKNKETEESSDENLDSSDDELDQLVDSDTEPSRPKERISQEKNEEDVDSDGNVL